nr:phosphatidylglycerophosphatase A [Prevotella sp.]
MNNHKYNSNKHAPLLPRIIATALGVGYWPWGPGTAGSLLGVIIWVAIGTSVPIDALNWFILALILLFTCLGIWATAKLTPMWGDDPSRVVIDEVVGVWTALLAAPAFEQENRIWMALAAFILFRFFDMVKPLGIKKLDIKQGAFWVMADDILAGIYSLIILIIIGNIQGWDI